MYSSFPGWSDGTALVAAVVVVFTATVVTQ